MICISIIAPTQKKALLDIKRGLSLCDLLELRMDLIINGKLSDLIESIEVSSPGKAVIVTHRQTKPAADTSGKVAGRFRKKEEPAGGERWAILEEAVRLGAAYVDVELEDEDVRVDALRAMIQQNGHRTKLICSHHDFQKTPTPPVLKKMYRACAEKGGDLVKIVPYAHSVEDNIRVLQFLTWAKGQGKEVVAFCMGEKGRLSRIAAPLFGAAFTFAALDEKSTAAPGQIAALDMIKILEILKQRGA